MVSGEISKLDFDTHQPFELGEWIVEPERLRIRRDGEIRELEPKCVELLVLFAAKYGHTLSRDEILDGLWGDRIVEVSVVKHLIWQLRKDLGDTANQPRYVDTIRRRGYRLVMAPRPFRHEDFRGHAVLNASAGSTAWLHQLPPPPPDFTGRQAELTELRKTMAGGGVVLLGLVGRGGIGKTALALKFAEDLTSHFPDAQIYLDLKGVGPEPLTTAQAMAHVIRSYRPGARLPVQETALGSLYRSVLYGQRALLVMDNAAGREQIEPLLPPRSCALVTTSRSSFTLPGLAVRNLDVLTVAESVALLERIAPRLGKEAGALAGLCGGLPIALRLEGSKFAERRDLELSKYPPLLSKGHDRLGPKEEDSGSWAPWR